MPGYALKQNDFPNEEVLQKQEAANLTVGGQLRAARENRPETLADISKILRISESYLLALEEDNRAGLPEIVYTIGFLKTYAAYLSLDVESLVQVFKQQFMQSIRSETLVFPIPTAERSIPTRSLIIIATGLAILLVGSWIILKPTSTVVDEFQHLSPVESVDIQKEKIQTSKEAQTLVSSAIPIAEESGEVASKTEESSTSVPETGTDVEFSQAHPVFPVPDTRPRSETLATQIILREDTIYLGEGKSFIIQAKEPCWVEVKSDKGQVIFTKTLKEGESHELPVLPNQIFSTGNAAGVSFYVDGKYYSGLGKHGEILKNKALRFVSAKDLPPSQP